MVCGHQQDESVRDVAHSPNRCNNRDGRCVAPKWLQNNLGRLYADRLELLGDLFAVPVVSYNHGG